MNRQELNSKDILLSKSLSWLLRHGAFKEGLSFEDGGFIDVQKILNLKQFKKFSSEDIIRVVNNNQKQRFTLRFKEENQELQIRANQGHSLPVEEDGLLTILTKDNAPPLVYHGTYSHKMKEIQNKGLNRMTRNHIHFTSTLPGEGEVISGMRQNCDAIIIVDTLKAMNDGFKFYISDNGVILCPGNEDGTIPSKYFKDIIYLSKKSNKR